MLSPDITIHRLTGDGPGDLLIAPLWSLKTQRLNHIHHELKVRDTWQDVCLPNKSKADTVETRHAFAEIFT